MRDKKLITLIFSGMMLLSTFAMLGSLAPPENTSTDPIRVMTYNIHQWYVQDPNEVSEKTGEAIFAELLSVIEDANPDILGLQESEGNRISSSNQNGVAWLAAKLDMYYYYGPDTSDQIYGVSILSKWPIIQQETVSLPIEESIDRVAIIVTIDSPHGEIKVLNTHFQTSGYPIDQELQANKVIELVSDDDYLVMGDFNAASTRNNEAYHILNGSLTDAWIAAGNHANSSLGFTSSASNPRNRVDHIFFTPGAFTVLPGSMQVYGSDSASDHLAMLGVFTVN
jgi:endonuclease/exonuclease/phosphatase family metal-dependent hydrolase